MTISALAQEAATGMTDKGLQQLGAGLAIGLAAGGGATGIGILWSKGLEGIGRQPEARGTLQGLMFVGFALAEAQVLYGLIVALLLLLGIF
ncbi:MAG TPA: ATP synthase F0 subunit C [Actinomycetota bacterium]|nr:ATP synthase F0 subunit C [Actinomycetota bacterium]